jgi:hypothetical protein
MPYINLDNTETNVVLKYALRFLLWSKYLLYCIALITARACRADAYYVMVALKFQ